MVACDVSSSRVPWTREVAWRWTAPLHLIRCELWTGTLPRLACNSSDLVPPPIVQALVDALPHQRMPIPSQTIPSFSGLSSQPDKAVRIPANLPVKRPVNLSPFLDRVTTTVVLNEGEKPLGIVEEIGRREIPLDPRLQPAAVPNAPHSDLLNPYRIKSGHNPMHELNVILLVPRIFDDGLYGDS